MIMIMKKSEHLYKTEGDLREKKKKKNPSKANNFFAI